MERGWTRKQNKCAMEIDFRAVGAMGSANMKEGENGNGGSSDGSFARSESLDQMRISPPGSPERSRFPPVFEPQVQVDPLQIPAYGPQICNQESANGSYTISNVSFNKIVPTLISWSHGGNHVMVEGSWDNWTSRKTLQRSGKNHSIMLVLPDGVYRYKFIADGEMRYIPELPHETNEMGQVANLLEVDDYVPENLDGVLEFWSPLSPVSSYSQTYPLEDFAKEPPAVPPQIQHSVLDSRGSDESTERPPHVALDHLYTESGSSSSDSVLTVGMTHRYKSKYVTVVLYKPVDQ